MERDELTIAYKYRRPLSAIEKKLLGRQGRQKQGTTRSEVPKSRRSSNGHDFRIEWACEHTAPKDFAAGNEGSSMVDERTQWEEK